MSIQAYMTNWWALHVCQEIQVKPSPLKSGFCILTLILFSEELGMLQRGNCVFSLLGNRSACSHCSLQQPLGKFQTWCIRELPGKREKWVRDPRALYTGRMRYSLSLLCTHSFYLQLLEKGRTQNNAWGNACGISQAFLPPLRASECYQLPTSAWVTISF